MKKLAKIKTLGELKRLAGEDDRYKQLLLDASSNLGGSHGGDVEKAYRWLVMNANETDEAGVVAEVNFCR